MTAWSVGIDVGTTSVKVAAVDDAGRLTAVTSAQHGIDPAAAGVQVDAGVWERSMWQALAELGTRVDLTSVQAVGLSGNMSSVVLVDEAGDPVAPVLLLADARGAEQLADLPEDILARIEQVSGNTPATVFALASLLWWRASHPQTLDRAVAWLSAKDHLRSRLVGPAPAVTDATDAHNGLLLGPAGWDEALVARLDLPRRLFVPVVASDACAGGISAAVSRATGIPVGTPVAVGAGDVAASALGFGGLADDEVAINLGTSAVLLAALGPSRPTPDAGRLGALTVHPDVDGGWFALGSLLTGGLALNWLRGVTDVDLGDVSDTPDPDDPLVFLPYLAGTGSPDFVPTATGSVLGVRPSTTSAHLAAALFEAVAFDVAGLVERLGGAGRYRRVVLAGGGSRIPAWRRVVADVLGLPVTVVTQPDLSAVGAALLGWRAAGRTVTPILPTTRVEPRPDHAPAWAVRRARHAAARAHLLDLSTTGTTTERNPR